MTPTNWRIADKFITEAVGSALEIRHDPMWSWLAGTTAKIRLQESCAQGSVPVQTFRGQCQCDHQGHQRTWPWGTILIAIPLWFLAIWWSSGHPGPLDSLETGRPHPDIPQGWGGVPHSMDTSQSGVFLKIKKVVGQRTVRIKITTVYNVHPWGAGRFWIVGSMTVRLTSQINTRVPHILSALVPLFRPSAPDSSVGDAPHCHPLSLPFGAFPPSLRARHGWCLKKEAQDGRRRRRQKAICRGHFLFSRSRLQQACCGFWYPRLEVWMQRWALYIGLLAQSLPTRTPNPYTANCFKYSPNVYIFRI